MYKHQLTSVNGTPLQIAAFYLTKASAKFEVASSNSLGDAHTRKYIILLLTFTLGQGQIRNFAQFPLHHMTYASAKFEVALSKGLGGNAFTRNISFDFDPRSRSHVADILKIMLWGGGGGGGGGLS